MTTFDRPVCDFMSTPVATIHPDATLADAEQRLEAGSYSCLGVVGEDGHLCGVLSRTDVLRIGRLRAVMAADPQLLKMPHQLVRARMIHNVVTADRTTPLHAAAAAMVQNHIHRIFVVENGRAVGVLSTRDLMRAIIEARVAEPIMRWMSSPVLTISASDSVAVATDLLQDARVRGLIVEDQDWPVGVYTQTEALAAAERDANTRVDEVMSCALLCLPPKLPLFRAAAFALDTRARRILAVASREMQGILSGLDMARVVACSTGGRETTPPIQPGA